jgi:deazaflavin-dependent oxidoreductase (nitroreductase family)
MKRRVVRLVQKHLVNPPMRLALRLGFLPPTHALLETTGHRSGQPRQNPVGNGLSDDGTTFWIVAEHGRAASYVRNIEANPRVRVRIGRTWRTGVAQVVPDDDPNERLRKIGRPVNGAMVKAMGTDLLSVRIDLDPPHDGRAGTSSAGADRP